VLEIRGILVQVLRVAAHRLLVEALALPEQLDVRADDRLDEVQQRGVERGAEERRAWWRS